MSEEVLSPPETTCLFRRQTALATASSIDASSSGRILVLFPFRDGVLPISACPPLAAKMREVASSGEIPRRSHSISIRSHGDKVATSMALSSGVKPGPHTYAVDGFVDVADPEGIDPWSVAIPRRSSAREPLAVAVDAVPAEEPARSEDDDMHVLLPVECWYTGNA